MNGLVPKVSQIDVPDWSLKVAHAIMEMVKAKDPETYHHCIRVSHGARLLAAAAGLSETEQKSVEFAGLFHDIGKVGIPDAVLLKPSKLTDDEYKLMMSHPVLSAQILKPLEEIDFFRRLLPGVLHHHERFDGQGYPNGVSGEGIPLASRMILIADTFDAMTAERPYRKGLPAEVAYAELKVYSSRQFDPRLVAIFLEVHPRRSEFAERRMFQEMNTTVLKRVA
jgi:putative nucleotidyltransferase with HDIG domain